VLARRRTLAERGEAYRRAFGVVPAFRAALHAGPVVAGEMGLAKREIVFLGDTMNTTARIETACRDLDCDTLMSGDVADHLWLPLGVAARQVGPVMMRGKSAPMPLFALAPG
jgi:adenylate cyclase